MPNQTSIAAKNPAHIPSDSSLLMKYWKKGPQMTSNLEDKLLLESQICPSLTEYKTCLSQRVWEGRVIAIKRGVKAPTPVVDLWRFGSDGVTSVLSPSPKCQSSISRVQGKAKMNEEGFLGPVGVFHRLWRRAGPDYRSGGDLYE